MIPLYDDIPTRRFPVVTVALIAANVAVFVFELTLPRYGLTLDDFYFRLGIVPYEVVHTTDVGPPAIAPWWLAALTSMFIHAGWLHVIFNMLFLWIFGNNVEDAMGRLKFLVFYLLCGLLAAAGHVVTNPHSQVPMIGASGAIAGVLGAYIVLYPRARVLAVLPIFFFIQLVYIPAWVMLGIWFVLQLLLGVTSLGFEGAGTAYFAHIGGFAAGLGLVYVFVPWLRAGGGEPPDGGPPPPRRRRGSIGRYGAITYPARSAYDNYGGGSWYGGPSAPPSPPRSEGGGPGVSGGT